MKNFDLLHKKWRFIALFQLSMIAKTENCPDIQISLQKSTFIVVKLIFHDIKQVFRENDTPWKKSHCYIKTGELNTHFS